MCMRIIAKRALREFWEANAIARTPLEDWYAQALDADWSTPAEVRAQFGDASILKGRRVVFNIGGNKYRLIAVIHYNRGTVFVRQVLTHREYDLGKWKDD